MNVLYMPITSAIEMNESRRPFSRTSDRSRPMSEGIMLIDGLEPNSAFIKKHGFAALEITQDGYIEAFLSQRLDVI